MCARVKADCQIIRMIDFIGNSSHINSSSIKKNGYYAFDQEAYRCGVIYHERRPCAPAGQLENYFVWTTKG